MSFSAKILKASISPVGVPFFTFEVTHPRYILAEVNTHRVLSKNSASSRAIPVEKMLSRIRENPYVPSHWDKNQKGMTAKEELNADESLVARSRWFDACANALASAEAEMRIGVHKQQANRLLEPFAWHTAILSGTEWQNFFHLRNNKDASPDFQTLARMMQEAYEACVPTPLDYGEWHLPLIKTVTGLEMSSITRPPSQEDDVDVVSRTVLQNGTLEDVAKTLCKISIARCARVSYLTHDGKRDLQADLDLYDKLLTSGHMSPFEHVARPATEDDGERMMVKWSDVEHTVGEGYGMPDPRYYGWFGNDRGWVQYRKLIPNEADILGNIDNEIKHLSVEGRT